MHSQLDVFKKRDRGRDLSSKFVMLALNLDVQQGFVVCAIPPCSLQLFHFIILEFAADGLLELCPADLLFCLFLLCGLVYRFEACLHAYSDGAFRTSAGLGVCSYFDGLVVRGREVLLACGAYIEDAFGWE